MVRQEHDVELINRIANSATVKPFIDYRADKSTPIDLSPAVGRITQTGIVWLSNGEDAVSCFTQTAPRAYEGHILFAETCRGRRALDTAKEMLAEMDKHADVIGGTIPLANRKTRWFARMLGFVKVGDDVIEGEGPVSLVVRIPVKH